MDQSEIELEVQDPPSGIWEQLSPSLKAKIIQVFGDAAYALVAPKLGEIRRRTAESADRNASQRDEMSKSAGFYEPDG